eukprot:CAMPEP_0206624450 /NCGR_PEP_ID=MMETSP0325_2-20121206/64132_1 /ASSEMBLY_ACC=CAM_ASM_000347 /TAXON_ID=2866 /ORGANISM="Crypthecodinium cohnii, Strain Seligo" /LENGTH=33 /DNA_ID= /DNA_START= /DNA_END= /DNA_ORIENTATION=
MPSFTPSSKHHVNKINNLNNNPTTTDNNNSNNS